VRLIYLDEAGTDHKAPVVGVGGVLIHGDRNWPEVDAYIRALIDKHIEPAYREGFVFHAKDIYHGSKYFDRNKPEWADRTKREAVLSDLATIIEVLGLHVIFGRYERANPLYRQVMRPDITPGEFTNFLHQMAAADCLSQADKWLEAHAPDELATVIHEDGTAAKTLIKRTIGILRSPEEMARSGIPDDQQRNFSFPLRRIIDTVHFAEKAEARPLQLADLVAFTFSRALGGRHVPPDVLNPLLKRITWIADPTLKPAPPEGQPS